MQETNSAASSGFLPQSTQRSRILRLKSSSTQGRPSANTQSAWSRIEAVAASRPVAPPSPSLGQRLGGMNLGHSSGNRPAVPWTGASKTIAIAPRPTVPVRQSPAPAPSVVRNTTEEFPSLPTVKPRERVVLDARVNPPRPVAQWGSQSGSSSNHNEGAAETVTKSKGKKKGKTILFHVG
jgi:hypothetical protein